MGTAKGHFLEVTPDKKVVWGYIGPFRAHRYSPGHAAFVGKDLDPAKFANLNRLYGPAAG
jgi:hypothetical protein